MLIPLSEVIGIFGHTPFSVAHIGGHRGQEAESYRDAGIERVVWFEANPAMIGPLRGHVEPFGHRVIEACLDETSGNEVTFHISDSANHSNDGQSSSLLELGTHRQSHPEVRYVSDITVTTSTLDDLMIGTELGGWMVDLDSFGDRDSGDGYGPSTLANLDVQGLELRVLQGAERFLAECPILYLEVNIAELYQGCARFPELEEWLMTRGYQFERVLLAGCQRVDCSDHGNRYVGWGDGIAIRRDNPTRYVDRHPECADWYR